MTSDMSTGEDESTRGKRCHDFVHCEEDIRRFAELFAIKAQHLAMGVSLLKRRKYVPTLPQASVVSNKAIVTGGESFVERFLEAVQKFETPAGDVVDEAFAIYALIEPKDTVKALSRTMNLCVASMADGKEAPNVYVMFQNEILKAESSTDEKHLQIDLDTKEPEKVKVVSDLLNEYQVPIVVCIETRGGFHIIYNNKESARFGRKLHEFKFTTALKKPNINGDPVTDYWFSITRHPNVIVPGTKQGGFPTRIISLDDWLAQMG